MKARFRPVQRRADFHQTIPAHRFQTRIKASRKREVSSRTIPFEIRPKLEALDPKYYQEIQQSKLDRTVAGISCAGLQQSSRLQTTPFHKIHPVGGEAGANFTLTILG